MFSIHWSVSSGHHVHLVVYLCSCLLLLYVDVFGVHIFGCILYICVYMHMCVSIWVHVYIFVLIIYVFVCACAFVCVCMHLCLCVCVCVCICVHACICACLCMCTHVCSTNIGKVTYQNCNNVLM